MSLQHKNSEFDVLVRDVKACTLCERMCNSARVLNYSAGNLRADIMFIGEAPGRLGADETEIPFHGDTSGNNFEELMDQAGINRNDVFVTNAALCNPKDERGNNSTPNAKEVENCSRFLKRQIDLVDPKIIVSLGAVALKALNSIESHGLSLKQHVRTKHPWHGRLLIPLYHPGQRAMIHRSFANQRSDYQFVADNLKQLKKPRGIASGFTRADVLGLAKYILEARSQISYFELHKLAYLTEYLHVRKTGRRLTGAYFIRQKDGPYCTDLQLSRLQRAEPSLKITKRGEKLFLSLPGAGTQGLFSPDAAITNDAKVSVEEALHRYIYNSEAELKTAVYMTAPMRNLLRREQTHHVNLFNAPIDFLAAT